MKKEYLQIFIFGLILLLSSQHTQGQIFQTKSEIIKESGYDYESGTTNDGVEYILYEKRYNSEQSGNFTQHIIAYFTTQDTKEEICDFYRLIEPSSETNSNVAFLKKNMVEIDYMKWKDYENNVIYQIEIEDGLCVTVIWYDYKNQ